MGTPTNEEIAQVLQEAMGNVKYQWEREGHIIYVLQESQMNGKNSDQLKLFRLENRNSRSNPPLPLRVSPISVKKALSMDIQCFMCPYRFIDKLKNSLIYAKDKSLQKYLAKCLSVRVMQNELEREAKRLRANIAISGAVYMVEREPVGNKKTIWCFERFTNRTQTAVECSDLNNPHNVARFKLKDLKQYYG